MKGLIALFLAIVLFGISWGYLEIATRQEIKQTVRKNLFPLIAAVLAVALAVTFSVNTTMRLV